MISALTRCSWQYYHDTFLTSHSTSLLTLEFQLAKMQRIYILVKMAMASLFSPDYVSLIAFTLTCCFSYGTDP